MKIREGGKESNNKIKRGRKGKWEGSGRINKGFREGNWWRKN